MDLKETNKKQKQKNVVVFEDTARPPKIIGKGERMRKRMKFNYV